MVLQGCSDKPGVELLGFVGLGRHVQTWHQRIPLTSTCSRSGAQTLLQSITAACIGGVCAAQEPLVHSQPAELWPQGIAIPTIHADSTAARLAQ